MRMTTKEKLVFYQNWKFWLLLSTMLCAILFVWQEYRFETRPPSADWSIPINLHAPIAPDFNRQVIMALPDDQGFVSVLVDEASLSLRVFDLGGKTLEARDYEVPKAAYRALQLGLDADSIYAYLTDRHSLHAMVINRSDYSLRQSLPLTAHGRLIAGDGPWLAAGDDRRLELYYQARLVAAYDQYSELRDLRLLDAGDTVYLAVNTQEGGHILSLGSDALAEPDQAKLGGRLFVSKVEQDILGYFKDLYLAEDSLYLISRYYERFGGGGPSYLGFWQLDRTTLELEAFQTLYHVQTDLDPIILGVDGEELRYILGMHQPNAARHQRLARYPQTATGSFANVSLLVRRGDILEANTRLTATSQYPLGYEYFQTGYGPVLVWADTDSGGGRLLMAGEGQYWQELARRLDRPQLSRLVATFFFFSAVSLGMGFIFLLLMLGPYYLWIGLSLVAALAYKHWMPLDVRHKREHLLYGGIVLFVLFKTLLMIGPGSDFMLYGHVYDLILGSPWPLLLLSLASTLAALGITRLWQKRHPYYTEASLHFGVYLAIEMYYFFIAVMIFFVSAHIKSNFFI